jgi:RNA polymerase sigma-70 factor (ECF subfamily)
MRQRGLQDADARDVTQQVILAVNQAVERWQPDGREASFRRWLFAIARKLSLKFIQRSATVRGPARRGAGGTDMLELLNGLPEPDHRTEIFFDHEYRTEVFHWAAQQIRIEFRESTWHAFWRTCVLNEPIAAVAERLGTTAGNVYVARTRVIARLRQKVRECEAGRDA